MAARSTVLNHHHDSERCPEQGNDGLLIHNGWERGILAWWGEWLLQVVQEDYELLNGEIFYNLKEAQIVIEQWR